MMSGTGKGMSLTLQVLIGMVAGMIIGLAFNIGGLNTEGSLINEYLVKGVFLVVGKMFVSALKMLVVPLVLFYLPPLFMKHTTKSKKSSYILCDKVTSMAGPNFGSQPQRTMKVMQ